MKNYPLENCSHTDWCANPDKRKNIIKMILLTIAIFFLVKILLLMCWDKQFMTIFQKSIKHCGPFKLFWPVHCSNTGSTMYIWPMKDWIGQKKWHHQAPKLDVRQHILNHLHQSYPCDSQPTGSRHLSSLPVPVGSNKVIACALHHSQSEVIIITSFYL